MDAMLSITSSPTKEGTAEVRSLIMDVLTTDRAGDVAKAEAFKALVHLTKAGDIHLSDCYFEGRGLAQLKKPVKRKV